MAPKKDLNCRWHTWIKQNEQRRPPPGELKVNILTSHCWLCHCQYPHCQIWRQSASSFVPFFFSLMYWQWEMEERRRERETHILTVWIHFKIWQRANRRAAGRQIKQGPSQQVVLGQIGCDSVQPLNILLTQRGQDGTHKLSQNSSQTISLQLTYNGKYKGRAHIELVPNKMYLHSVETRSVHETVSCSFSSSELSSLKQAICFCAVLLGVFVWIKAEGPLYLLATVATNTEVFSLLPEWGEKMKGRAEEARKWSKHSIKVWDWRQNQTPKSLTRFLLCPLTHCNLNKIVYHSLVCHFRKIVCWIYR